MKITKETKTHLVWENWKKFGKKQGLPSIVGKDQYLFSSKKGKISLITLEPLIEREVRQWEIYCLEGNLFEDIERFLTEDKAVHRIVGLLE